MKFVLNIFLLMLVTSTAHQINTAAYQRQIPIKKSGVLIQSVSDDGNGKKLYLIVQSQITSAWADFSSLISGGMKPRDNAIKTLINNTKSGNQNFFNSHFIQKMVDETQSLTHEHNQYRTYVITLKDINPYVLEENLNKQLATIGNIFYRVAWVSADMLYDKLDASAVAMIQGLPTGQSWSDILTVSTYYGNHNIELDEGFFALLRDERTKLKKIEAR